MYVCIYFLFICLFIYIERDIDIDMHVDMETYGKRYGYGCNHPSIHLPLASYAKTIVSSNFPMIDFQEIHFELGTSSISAMFQTF